MDLTEWFTDFFAHVPANRRACDTCGHMIEPSFLVLLSDEDVFREVVQEECKGMYSSDVSLVTKNSVREHASPVVILEKVRIPLAEVLYNHLHVLLCCCLASW